MNSTSHLDKLNAASTNEKCSDHDREILGEAKRYYEVWIESMRRLTSTGEQRVQEMVTLLNDYKDMLEVELIARRGSAFLKRQKGQLKIDNSVMEEFLPHLVCPEIIDGLTHTRFQAGPQKAFMSLSFMPRRFEQLGQRPEVEIGRAHV